MGRVSEAPELIIHPGNPHNHSSGAPGGAGPNGNGTWRRFGGNGGSGFPDILFPAVDPMEGELPGGLPWRFRFPREGCLAVFMEEAVSSLDG